MLLQVTAITDVVPVPVIVVTGVVEVTAITDVVQLTSGKLYGPGSILGILGNYMDNSVPFLCRNDTVWKWFVRMFGGCGGVDNIGRTTGWALNGQIVI